MKHFLYLFLLLSIGLNAQVCDPNNYSVHFDGSTYVSILTDSLLNIEDEITVEAWIYATSWANDPALGSIVCKHGWTMGEKGYVLRAGGSGQLSFNIFGVKNSGVPEGWVEAISNSNTLRLNTWEHVAATYDGDKIKLYINGTKVKEKGFKGTIEPSPDYKMKIGRVADEGAASGRFWHGLIDEVRVWHDVRTQSEINSNRSHHLDTAVVSKLVGYWRFNEPAGTMISDRGDGANTGMLMGAMVNTNVPFTNGVAQPVIIQVGGLLVSSSLTGNQWNLNGVPIPGETGISITPSVNGFYSVTADYGMNCISTSDEFEYLSVGISESEQQTFSYTVSNSILKLLMIENSRGTFSIYDLNGRLVQSMDDQCQYCEMSVSGLVPGVYIVRFYGEKGVLSRPVFIH